MPVEPMSIGAVRAEGASRDIQELQVSLVGAAATAHGRLSGFSGEMEWFAPRPGHEVGGARATPRHRSALGFVILERHRVKFEAVIDQPIPKPPRDLRLQP